MGALEIIIGILALISFIWVTINVWSNDHSRYTTLSKVLWTVAAFFFSILTAIVYYLLEKQKALK